MSSYYDDASLMLLASGGAQKDGKVYSVKPVPVYGANIITPIANSDFSSDTGYWNLETNISISGGSMNMSATPNNASFYKTGIIQIGKSYRVEITISGYSEGFIDSNNGNNFSFPAANGIHTFYFVGGNAALVFSANGTTTLSVDNVSVKEVLVEDGDFTFTRGSNLSATRVDASQLIEKGRENLVLYSEQFNNGYWDKREYGSGTIPSVTADYGIAPNGTNTADRVQFPSQSGIQVSSLQTPVSFTYPLLTASVYVKTISGTCSNLVLRAGASEYNVPSFGTTWTRIETFSLSNAANEGLAIRNRPSTSGDGSAIDILVWGAQVEQGLVATPYIETGASTAQAGILENTPRFDYSGGATCPSLLLEPSRTNLLTQSEYFGSSDWAKLAGVSLTDNATISPDGSQNATHITWATSGSNTQLYNVIQTTGAIQVLSLFVKYISGSGTGFRLSIGSSIPTGINLEFSNNGATLTGAPGVNVSSYKIEDYGNQWFRVSVVVNYSSSSLEYNLFRYSGASTDVYAIWGAQVEGSASYATSYIPTYGVSQTRAQDVCNSAGDAATFNDSEGVLYAETSVLSNDLNIEAISISDGTGNNRVVIFKWNTSNAIRARITSGGYSVNLDFQVSDITSINKIAVKYKTNDFALWINGIEVRTNTNGANPIGLNQLSFNSDGGTGAPFYGNTKQVIVFPTALSDLDLAILTGATTYNTFAAMALALNYTVYE